MSNIIDTAVIFAAGLGSRMGRVTQEIPKPLATINNGALLDLVMRQVLAAGIKHVVINVHYKARSVVDHVINRDNGMRITIVEEPELFETGGSLVNILNIIGHFAPILTCNVDTIWMEKENEGCQISKLLAKWDSLPEDKQLLMLVSNKLYGAPNHKDFKLQDGRLFYTPDAQHYYVGSQIINPKLLDPYRDQKKFSLVEVYRGITGDDGMMKGAYGLEFDGQDIFHVGDEATLNVANEHAKQHISLNW